MLAPGTDTQAAFARRASEAGLGTRHQHRQPLTRDQVRDSGMALCLLCWLAGAGLGLRWLEWTAMAVLVIDMIAPAVFRPFAVVWFGGSEAIGAVTSKVLLSVLFFLLVLPMGLVRRWIGHDPMQVRRWKRSRVSVFRTRDHLYTARDVERPY